MSNHSEQKIVGQPALFRRLAAMFYDTWLVGGCLLAGSAIINGLTVFTAEKGDLVEGELALNTQWEMLLFTVSVAIFWSFFSYLWVKSGQTLGMQTWRLRIDNINEENIENQRITYTQASIRLIVACFSLACFGLGYLWCFIDKNQQTWHDKISKSQVVFLEKRKG